MLVTETRAATLSPIQGEDAEIMIRKVLKGLESGAGWLPCSSEICQDYYWTELDMKTGNIAKLTCGRSRVYYCSYNYSN